MCYDPKQKPLDDSDLSDDEEDVIIVLDVDCLPAKTAKKYFPELYEEE